MPYILIDSLSLLGRLHKTRFVNYVLKEYILRTQPNHLLKYLPVTISSPLHNSKSIFHVRQQSYKYIKRLAMASQFNINRKCVYCIMYVTLLIYV